MKYQQSKSLCLILIYLISCQITWGQDQSKGSYYIHQANILTMEGEEILINHTLRVENGKIHSITPSDRVAIPSGARIIDASGKFLIPALSDMHVHLEGQAWNIMYPPGSGYSEEEIEYEDLLFLYLAHGITTVEVMSAFPEHIKLRERIRCKELLGPDLVLARMIDGEGRAWPPPISTWVSNEEAASRAVEEVAEMGYDRLKVYSFLDSASYFSIMSKALELGLPVDGHIPLSVGVEGIFAGGQHMIAHCEELLNFADLDKDGEVERLATQCAESDTWLSPTLVTTRNLIALLDSPESELNKPGTEYLHPQGYDIWNYLNDNLYAPIPDAHRDFIQKGFDEFQQPFVREFHRKGGKLLAGTDALIPPTLPGTSLHDELEELVMAGLTPFEALQTSTTNPHIFLEQESVAGTITTGKQANLLLLDKNPLDNIRDTRSIAGVVIHGIWITLDEIKTRLDEISARYSQLYSSRLNKP